MLQSCAQEICKFMRQKTFSTPASYNTGIKISYQILKQKSPDGHHLVTTTGDYSYVLRCGHVHIFTAADHKK